MGIDSLTQREREVLLHVGQGLQTDEIARVIARSPSTVDNAILSARRKLGGVSRRQAARLLAEVEGRQRLPGHPLPVPHFPSNQQQVERQADVVEEERLAFLHEPAEVRHTEPGASSGEYLRTIALILAISAAVIFILGATPGLIASFRVFSAWILSTFYSV